MGPAAKRNCLAEWKARSPGPPAGLENASPACVVPEWGPSTNKNSIAGWLDFVPDGDFAAYAEAPSGPPSSSVPVWAGGQAGGLSHSLNEANSWIGGGMEMKSRYLSNEPSREGSA